MHMIFRMAVAATALTLTACGGTDASKPETEATTESEAVSSGSDIPSQWQKYESRDEFTDELTKSYTVDSNGASDYKLSVACSKGNKLNFYFEYPERSGSPSMEMEVNVRVGSGQPFTERWFVSWVSGSTRVENPQEFYEKIRGQSKLAVEIFGASRGAYDISGIDAVVADMQATACKFEEAAPPPAEGEPQAEDGETSDGSQ